MTGRSHGFGSVVKACQAIGSIGRQPRSGQVTSSDLDMPCYLRNPRTAAAAQVESMERGGVHRFDIPAFLRRQANQFPKHLPSRQLAAPPTPEQLLEEFERASLRATSLGEAVRQIEPDLLGSPVATAVESVVQHFRVELADRMVVWALALDIFASMSGGRRRISRHLDRLIRNGMAMVSEPLRSSLRSALEQALLGAGVTSD